MIRTLLNRTLSIIILCFFLSGIYYYGLVSYYDNYVFSSEVRSLFSSENIEDYSNSYESYTPDLDDYYIEKYKFLSDARAIENTKYNIGLCTSLISNPVEPSEEDKAWEGCYVVFGSYDDRFVTYRVLDKDCGKFGGNTLFLDCDCVLLQGKFREDLNRKTPDDIQNLWSGSDIRKRLNGEEFLYNEECFTDVERESIFESFIGSHELNGQGCDDQIESLTAFQFENYTPLNGDKIFCLDVEDAYNSKYGYSDSRDLNLNHHKEYMYSDARGWWVRSTYKSDPLSAATINLYGNLYINPVNDDLWPGISPALNIDREKILFSSYYDSFSNVFKLTLLDENINISATGKLSKNGRKVFVPYKTIGTDCNLINRFSVILLDKPYTPGNENEAELIDYLKAYRDKDSRSLTFELPENYEGNLYIYLLAEKRNSSDSSNYASKPYLLELPDEDVYYVMPGDTLWKISKKLEVDVKTLIDKNDIEDPNLILPGQEIIFK